MADYISFHLIPCEEQIAEYYEIAESLALRFDGPKFEPHLTLYYGERKQDIDPKEVLDAVAADLQRMTLRVSGSAASETWSKALYAVVEPTADLLDLSAALSCCFVRPESYSFNPHLTLLYAALSKEQIAMLSKEVRIRESTLFFDCIRIKGAFANYTSREHIEAEPDLYTVALQSNE